MAFSNVPVHSKIFTQQAFVSEDLALKELIKECSLSAANILVFDRGLRARSTFEEFNESGSTFITRLNNNTRFETVRVLEIQEKETQRLLLEKNLEVILYDKYNKRTNQFLRLTIAKEKQTGEVFYFLANNKTL